jgi:nucleoside-diphosphate-sugar epimerase
MEIKKHHRILITGGKGFLGSRLYDVLKHRGYEHVFAVGGTRSGTDLGEEATVGWLFQRIQPDVVIHLAARTGGFEAYAKHPGGYIYENLNMGLKVLEEARHYNCLKFIMAGSIVSYPDTCPIPFKETDLWNGSPDPSSWSYGVAKRSLMELVAAYGAQFSFDTITLIFPTLYGPEDKVDPRWNRILPDIITRVKYNIQEETEEFPVWNHDQTSRDFLYVDDAAESIVLAMERCNESDIINVGTGVEVTIRDLITKVCEIMDYKGEVVWNDTPPEGQPRKYLDITKCKNKLGFEAKTSLEDGLKETIDWVEQTRAAVMNVPKNELPEGEIV